MFTVEYEMLDPDHPMSITFNFAWMIIEFMLSGWFWFVVFFVVFFVFLWVLELQDKMARMIDNLSKEE